MTIDRRAFCAFAAAALAAPAASAATAAEIDARVSRAVEEMYATVPGARELHDRAVGLLMMPSVVKGGLIVGGAYGEGALLVDGATVAYYSVAQGSVGLQAGVQSTKQALFFMTGPALRRFRDSEGWEIGADAEVSFPGDGLAAGINTTTSTSPVIGVVFGQDGLLAGASLEGGKYTEIAPD